jgi:hypothetical protein
MELPELFCQVKERCAPTVPILIVGMGPDDSRRRVVSAADAQAFAAERGLRYVEASARDGNGAREAFDQMDSMIRGGVLALPRSLLWRGSRDGFRAADFHRCCDGPGYTLTLIRDINRNIFGGFAEPPWGSRVFVKAKAGESPAGFLFTLKNPHNLPPRNFKLIPRRRSSAIKCSLRQGPCFGDEDLVVSDACNVKPSHCRGFGSTYENDIGIQGRCVLTGSETFIVSEIEVFAPN